MDTGTFVFVIIATLLIAFLIVKFLEKVIKKRFYKIKSVLTVATAYDLCLLYRQKIISEKELLEELSHWVYVPENTNKEQLRDEWKKLLPPDPFGSFEEQIGRAHEDGLISPEIYDYLMKTYVTTDDVKKQQENDE